MNDINKYLDILIEYAKRKLGKHFNIDKLELSQFETINSYLIYQAINKKKKNTLIQIPDKETKSQFYIPAIFTIALYNFVDNYIDDTTIYEIGDVLQNQGVKYKIVNTNGNNYTLKGSNNITKFLTHKQIKKYTITTAGFNDRRAKIKFDLYKKFFTDILKIGKSGGNIELPSKFKYKSVIVTDKNIEKELKLHLFDKEKIHKAFPFQYITKSGKITSNIPIDPMIYIVNEYETARKHLFNRGINVRNVAFIGANKYKDNYLEISEDLNKKRIENCLLIGSGDVQNNSIPNLYHWKWTLPELDYFNYIETYPVKTFPTNNLQFSEHLNDFTNTITKIEESYGLNLSELYKFVKNLFPIVIPSNTSRLIKQLDNIQIYFEKDGLDIFETAFYEIDEYDTEELWEEVLHKFTLLVNSKKEDQSKFDEIHKMKYDHKFYKIHYLVVPKEYLEVWKEEIKHTIIQNVITFKEFKQLQTTQKRIVFLGFYGYNHLKAILYNFNKISILLNPQEKEHYKLCFNRFRNETNNHIKDSDRTKISGISFKETEKFEDVSDLIKRLFNQSDSVTTTDYSTYQSDNIEYQLTFENSDDIFYLEGNKTVLLKLKEKEREERIKNLMVGDSIRIYDNSDRSQLYTIAHTYDNSGKFNDIEKYSRLWKDELYNFKQTFESTDDLLAYLITKGISITSVGTLRNWINPNSNIKFPQKNKDLTVLKKTIDSDNFNNNFNNILKSKKFHTGIMIALGRDFSDEISDYIKENKKGKILNGFSTLQIQQFVSLNAKERTIKKINVLENE